MQRENENERSEYERSSVFKEKVADAGKMELFQGMLSHLQLCTTSDNFAQLPTGHHIYHCEKEIVT